MYSSSKYIIAACLSLLFFAGVPVGALAQDADYYNEMWYSCELTDHRTEWKVVRFKEGVSWVNETKPAQGKIVFSDDCVEIFLEEGIQMHFPVGEYKRLSPDIFCITRATPDDMFDYIEVVRYGKEYRFMMAHHEDDGTLFNTKIFTCWPTKRVEAKSESDARKSTTRAVENFPPQVPKK